MITWCEPPKARVGCIPWEDRDEYDRLSANGEPCQEGEEIALLVRKRDRKVLRPASWMPVAAWRALTSDPLMYGRPQATNLCGLWVEEV